MSKPTLNWQKLEFVFKLVALISDLLLLLQQNFYLLYIYTKYFKL